MPQIDIDDDSQGVPKPDGYTGGDGDAWVMTGQDGRLAYDPGSGSLKDIEEVRQLRNPRPVDKH